MEKPQMCPRGLWAGSSGKVVCPEAQLKSPCINACSTGNNEGLLGTVVRLENLDLTAITATWWDDSHNWNTTVEGIQPFRRGRQGGRAEGAALRVQEWIDYEELPLRNRNRQRACGLKIRGGANKRQVVVRVCYRPPDQEEPLDGAFLHQLREPSCWQALIVMGDFNCLNICCQDSTVTCKQSWRLLEKSLETR